MGYPANILVGQSGGTAPMSQFPQTPTVASGSNQSVSSPGGSIDGTPLRVATLVAVAVAGLWGLKQLNFKFNVTAG